MSSHAVIVFVVVTAVVVDVVVVAKDSGRLEY